MRCRYCGAHLEAEKYLFLCRTPKVCFSKPKKEVKKELKKEVKKEVKQKMEKIDKRIHLETNIMKIW